MYFLKSLGKSDTTGDGEEGEKDPNDVDGVSRKKNKKKLAFNEVEFKY